MRTSARLSKLTEKAVSEKSRSGNKQKAPTKSKSSSTRGKRRAETDDDESSGDDRPPTKRRQKAKSKAVPNEHREEVDLSDDDPPAPGEVVVRPSEGQEDEVPDKEDDEVSKH
jgi:hypothetical protein